mmetsp:Transcript_67258/g.207980  ORF Transcript_67258/g.207980 Transcript_67258/m.207980 type:complete len:202 (+) Transcript_67258:1652-2257(+)
MAQLLADESEDTRGVGAKHRVVLHDGLLRFGRRVPPEALRHWQVLDAIDVRDGHVLLSPRGIQELHSVKRQLPVWRLHQAARAMGVGSQRRTHRFPRCSTLLEPLAMLLLLPTAAACWSSLKLFSTVGDLPHQVPLLARHPRARHWLQRVAHPLGQREHALLHLRLASLELLLRLPQKHLACAGPSSALDLAVERPIMLLG